MKMIKNDSSAWRYRASFGYRVVLVVAAAAASWWRRGERRALAVKSGAR
jgi:hypothetical protein